MRSLKSILVAVLLCLPCMSARGEVILQYFETEWDEIYARLPELGEMGIDALWVPSPCKSPVAGTVSWGNVGYSLYDRFDVGDIPQRGSLKTRYGTRGSLRRMVDHSHYSDIKIYPDVVFNHNGNGPDYRTYPGMSPTDFHVWENGGAPGGYVRAPRMSNYDDISNGYGQTFKEELVSLIDVRTETHDWGFAAEPSPYVRHPGQYDKYPFQSPGQALPNENVRQMLGRWAHWLGDAMDYDGFRLDAAKHVVAEFYGGPGAGFLHEAQWSFDSRRLNAYDANVPDLYLNDIRRNDMLMFAEIFTGSSATFDYWRNASVKMRYLDFPMKQSVIGNAFGGNLGALASIGVALDPTEGVTFIHSHDQNAPSKMRLGYAWLLTHVGVPVVYFSGNNINWDDNGSRTWVLPGHEASLGDFSSSPIPNLVYIHNQFARGREWTRVNENDYFAYERYDDLNSNSSPDSGEGLLLVALNDSGWDQTRSLSCSFPEGTRLKDYTGNNGNDVWVSGGQVSVTVPAMSGEGYVCYAPYTATADGEGIRLSSGGQVGTMSWVVPGGRDAANKSRTIPRVTTDSVDIEVHYADPLDGSVNNTIIKWGRGRDLNAGASDFTGSDVVSGGYEQATYGGGIWTLTADTTGIPEGLHLVKARLFNTRAGGLPALYQTFQQAVYVDRHGPDLNVVSPSDGETVMGDVVVHIENSDRTAGLVEVSVDGGDYQEAHEVMPGLWKFAVTGESAGSHELSVRAREYDLASVPSEINTSTTTRSYSVDTSGPALAINHSEGREITLPFFLTRLTSAGASASDVTLWWDGYEMTGLSGSGTIDHTFAGGYTSGGVADTLYGAFVNGPHFFEAEVVLDGQTSRVCRTVHFNLYGNHYTDSDGDGLPDDVEVPGFTGGLPPHQHHPGDDNQDMIPNNGENWSRLNPTSHDTFYNGTWDGDEDWDSDGKDNLCEVMQGFLEHGNPFHYDIYDGSSAPASCTISEPSQVTTECNPNTLNITYEPKDGPLASYVGALVVMVGHDGFQDIVDGAMTANGNAWEYAYAISNATTTVDFYFRDAVTNIDNNGGADWEVDITDCNNENAEWIGATYHWPPNTELDAGEDLWINTESYPVGKAISGSIVWSTDGGTNWHGTNMVHNGVEGNNDLWHINLGGFAAGTVVEYAVNVTDGNAVDHWDSNNNQNYEATVNFGDPVIWVGNTYHWPTNGAIDGGEDLWINTESYPAGAAVSGEVIFSTDGGSNWGVRALNFNGVEADNDHWHVNLGSFAIGATIEYAVKTVDGLNDDMWDSRDGSNYVATVNGAASSLGWFGNTGHGGFKFPVLEIRADTGADELGVDMDELKAGVVYSLLASTDLVSWASVTTFTSSDDISTYLQPGGLSGADSRRFYRVESGPWPESAPVFSGEDLIIEIETYPQGAATGVNLVYSSDGGSNWLGTAMMMTGSRGNNDLWQRNLGVFPIGTQVLYAVEVIDDQATSNWDNNDSQNYQVYMQDPDQTDFEAPVLSYTPANTTTEDSTLSVSFSATDNIDLSPTIHYTTNGTTPTVASAVYAGTPVLVGDQGGGVDMTIKAIAVDDSGNQSVVTTVDVRVNESFNYGGSQPYSTNPTLGAGVANGAITVDGVNNGEWDTNKLIAIDMANDDSRSLGDNWTMHEAPVDFTHMWAAWDDNKLYLAWQLVDVTDVVDPSNAGSGDVVSGNDGILQWIVLDTIPGQGAEVDMWDKNEGEPYWTGDDKPDFQIYIASSLWQGYISEAVDGVFPVDDGGVHYFSTAAAGIETANGNHLVAQDLWGTWDVDNRYDGPSLMNFVASGHGNTSRDSFYEMSIPLAHLGLTRADLESDGLGIMIGMAIDTVPHDEATLDTPGVEVWNSPLEWGDVDTLTVPFGRIGSWK